MYGDLWSELTRAVSTRTHTEVEVENEEKEKRKEEYRQVGEITRRWRKDRPMGGLEGRCSDDHIQEKYYRL